MTTSKLHSISASVYCLFRLYAALFIIIQMKSVFACTSMLNWNPKFYYRDPFPRCYPTYLINDEKPTAVSLNGSGGVVSHLPHDLTLWQDVIRRLETQLMEYVENKVTMKPNLTLVFVGGSMLSGIMQSEFLGLTKCTNYTSTVNPLQDKRECAYPARFGDWLQAAYPQAAVHIYNFGVGGSVSAGALTKLTPMLDSIPTSIDIVFLHYLNNDALSALQEKNMEVSMGYEDIVRHFLSMGAAVIDLPMFVDYLPKRFQLVNGVLRTHEIVSSIRFVYGIIRSSCTLYYDLFHKCPLCYCLLTFLLIGDKLLQGSCSRNRAQQLSIFEECPQRRSSRPRSCPAQPAALEFLRSAVWKC